MIRIKLKSSTSEKTYKVCLKQIIRIGSHTYKMFQNHMEYYSDNVNDANCEFLTNDEFLEYNKRICYRKINGIFEFNLICIYVHLQSYLFNNEQFMVFKFCDSGDVYKIKKNQLQHFGSENSISDKYCVHCLPIPKCAFLLNYTTLYDKDFKIIDHCDKILTEFLKNHKKNETVTHYKIYKA